MYIHKGYLRLAEAKVDVLEVSKLQECELNGDVQFIHVLETSSPVHLRFDRENISLKSGESFLTQGISETVELQTEFGEFATVFIITIDLL